VRATSSVENVGIDAGGAAPAELWALAPTPPPITTATNAACTACVILSFIILFLSFFTCPLFSGGLNFQIAVLLNRGAANVKN
jgi:hypothetical protein